MTDNGAIEIAMMKRALDPAYPSFTFNTMRLFTGLDTHWRTVDRLLQKWRKAGFASHQRQGRHEVRGHFMHFGLTEGCEHAWDALPDKENRWTCLHCGGRRTWRKDFLRGDAGVGFVSKDYTAV